LKHERDELEAILDQMPAGVVVAEAPSGRILSVNEHARTLLGLAGADVNDVLGRYVREGTPLAGALEGQAVAHERVERTKPDGSVVVLGVTASPVLDSSGRITASVSIFEDVTLREARERAEFEFVMNAAHELQTPLAAIRSAVEVLQAGAKDAAERDLFIGHIERESERLERLTRALLTLARARTEFENPRTELIELCPLLEAIAERMEPALGVSLTVDCPVDLALVSNHELLVQAVSNVVRNSVKYTQAGSIRLTGRASAANVDIVVSDTGSGISKEALPLVADRFYQADVSKEGFGLGLAIVRSAVEVLGGTLEIVSGGVDRGTTVTMTLPTGATMVEP
jgi:PAS domain S-box-containing protein